MATTETVQVGNVEAVKITEEAELMQGLEKLQDGEFLLYIKNQRQSLFMKMVLGRESVYIHYDLSAGRPMAADLKDMFQVINSVKELGKDKRILP